MPKKKSKDRLRDPALEVTMQVHATYSLTFLTYLYTACQIKCKVSLLNFAKGEFPEQKKEREEKRVKDGDLTRSTIEGKS